MKRRDFLQGAAALAAAPVVGGLDRLVPAAGPAPAAGGPSGEGGARSRGAPLRVNGARLNGWLERFSSVGRTEGGINRVAYSENDVAGRAFTLDLFREAGLAPRIDAAGNIVGRLEGTDPSLPVILIGSHVDSVTDGGNYDGPVGSFSALEVASSLQEQHVHLRHPLEVVVWQNEEGGTIGSKLATGEQVDLDAVARSGKTIRDGIGIVGGDAARLPEAVRPKGSVACYVELHIEQGGTLERAGLRIGVVEGIVGLRWMDVTIEGFANHAGTTPMDQRHDALLAAAKFTVAVNDAIRAEPGRQVATVGRMIPSPNTRNVIPGQVVMSVDLRDLDVAKLDRFTETFRKLAEEVGRATGTTFRFSQAVRSEPAFADERIMGWIEASCEALGLSRQRMPSGAGHDAQEVARIAPMGMIFVPSAGGISHSPREFTAPEDVANGASVLLNTVIAADR